MSRALTIVSVYQVTFIVASAWAVYGLGYARGFMSAHRRGVQRQKDALRRQQEASNKAMDGLARLQREFVQQIQREHVAELQRAADAAVADALANVAPHPIRRAS